MVKVKGPMMSLDASGTLGDSVTFSKWKGRSYVRERVVPSNPRSGAQVGRRAMFNFLSKAWTSISDADQATWQDLADQLVASTFAAYMSHNMQRWHNYLGPTEAFPAAEIGSEPTISLDAAAWEENRIKLTFGSGSQNDGWAAVIGASVTTPITIQVANVIGTQLAVNATEVYYFWTPPAVATYYFKAQFFTTSGKKFTAGDQKNAAP